MSAPKILIATSRHDGLNYGAVMQHLTTSGCEVLLFEPDGIADGSREFTMRIGHDGKTQFSYDNKPFDPASFDAAWHRRPNYFGEHKDTLRWLSLKDEYSSLMKAIAELIPEKRWLNTAQNMIHAGQKLPQLIKAAQHGFVIPDTIVSNTWQQVDSMPADEIIVKYAELTILYPKGFRKVLPTTVLTKDKLPKHIASYPGIWQSFVEKCKEWRVTVVGDHVFSAAIYSDDIAKDDWRKHQDTTSITFEAEEFPRHLADKCRSFLKMLNLRYGAYDFIERPDGTIVFLEVNPNGQFQWLEEKLGLPISAAIADELMAIAAERS